MKSLVIQVLALHLLIVHVIGERCDPEDQECITLAVRRIYPIIMVGDPSLGVQPTDPITTEIIEAHLPTLNYTLTDVEMHGYSNCTVTEARFRVREGVWHVSLDCPKLQLFTNYIFKGYVASELLDGEGKANFTFLSYEISLNGGLQKETRGNKEHIKLTNPVATRLEVVDKIDFRFSSLYNNDPERTERMTKFINDHAKEFNSQAQTPGMQAVLSVMVDHFNQYFDKVPVDEIFIKV